MLDGVVFDLDDTLYFERDYVESGFRAIGHEVERAGGPEAAEVSGFLTEGFACGVRGDAFDRLRDAFPEVASRFDTAELVGLYRDHRPTIRVLPEMRRLLMELRQRGLKLGIITDGHLAGQQRKIAALGVASLVDTPVMTDRWGREGWKPCPRAFEHVSDDWHVACDRLAYVGDNPMKDFLAPNRLGWSTIRLRLAPQLRYDDESPSPEHRAQLEVNDVEALRARLEEQR